MDFDTCDDSTSIEASVRAYDPAMASLASYRALFDLSHNNAVVIGAGSGIGEACAWALAAHGANVTCADLSPDSASAVAAAIEADGGKTNSTGVDITDAASLVAMFDSDVDVRTVVITPSINVRKPLLEMTEEEFASVVDLNL